MAASGKQQPKKTTGKQPVVKTGSFKTARTAPVVKGPEQPTAAAVPAAPPPEAEPEAAAVTGSTAAVPGAPTGDAPAVEPTTVQPKTASGKTRATTGRMGALKASSSRVKSPSGRSAGPKSLPKTGREIWITCRECREEWTVDPDRAKSQETICCPICEHRAQAPNDDILHQIALYKGIEQKNATIAVGAFLVGLFTMLLWTLLTANPRRAEEPALFWGPIAIAVISLVVTVVFTRKYESSRWETYF